MSALSQLICLNQGCLSASAVPITSLIPATSDQIFHFSVRFQTQESFTVCEFLIQASLFLAKSFTCFSLLISGMKKCDFLIAILLRLLVSVLLLFLLGLELVIFLLVLSFKIDMLEALILLVICFSRFLICCLSLKVPRNVSYLSENFNDRNFRFLLIFLLFKNFKYFEIP